MKQSRLSKWVWFVGIWMAGVLVLGLVTALIKIVLI